MVVALGGAAEGVRAQVDLHGCTLADNPAFGTGCSSSIAAAVPALDTATDVVVLLLGDQPGVGAATVRTLLAGRGDAPLAVCRYDDGIGHPFAFGRAVLPDLAALHGDKAVWKLLDQRSAEVVEVRVDGPGAARRRHRGGLRAAAAVRRARVGQLHSVTWTGGGRRGRGTPAASIASRRVRRGREPQQRPRPRSRPAVRRGCRRTRGPGRGCPPRARGRACPSRSAPRTTWPSASISPRPARTSSSASSSLGWQATGRGQQRVGQPALLLGALLDAARPGVPPLGEQVAPATRPVRLPTAPGGHQHPLVAQERHDVEAAPATAGAAGRPGSRRPPAPRAGRASRSGSPRCSSTRVPGERRVKASTSAPGRVLVEGRASRRPAARRRAAGGRDLAPGPLGQPDDLVGVRGEPPAARGQRDPARRRARPAGRRGRCAGPRSPRDTAGSLTPSSSAAARIEPSRATSAKARSWLNVTGQGARVPNRWLISTIDTASAVSQGPTARPTSVGRAAWRHRADPRTLRLRPRRERRARAGPAGAARPRVPRRRRRPQPAADDEAAAGPARVAHRHQRPRRARLRPRGRRPAARRAR